MEIDDDRVDGAVLALMWLTLHDGDRASKGFDWATSDRLHRKGLIEDPVNRAKSVVLTQRGAAERRGLFEARFTRPA